MMASASVTRCCSKKWSNVSKSCPKCSHSSYSLNGANFQTSPKLAHYLGYFFSKICRQNLKKQPNLVTLVSAKIKIFEKRNKFTFYCSISFAVQLFYDPSVSFSLCPTLELMLVLISYKLTYCLTVLTLPLTTWFCYDCLTLHSLLNYIQKVNLALFNHSIFLALSYIAFVQLSC